MKSSYLRAGIALACTLGLAGCGGSNASLLLGGTVSGVTKDGLVLQNNGGHDFAVPAGASTFYFDDMIGNDTAYNVTVKSSPPNASCVVQNGTGKSGAFNVSSVAVVCTIFTHALGGTVTGLGDNPLVVVNGSDRVTIPGHATTFSMQKVAEDAPYGIVVLPPQPAGQTCSITNGVGTMGTADIGNVAIDCVPPAP